ncbi:MAG TPA: nucleotidyltransferase family protein [Candidatus Nanoarchaeia archaeon]|nr:nucleotidyltransferase family protein [Candidatus Nanoarchaeia archaeon]
MRAIILAGGYAKRLLPVTQFFPKSLLPVAGKPIINYLLENLEKTKISRIYVSTNKKFENNFKHWYSALRNRRNIKLCVEESNCEENKLGALKALNALVVNEKINDDTLIIAGDNIFDFQLNALIDFYNKKRSSVIAFKDIKNIEKVRERFGVGVINSKKKLVDFEEKPKNPKSSLVSTGCYILTKNDLKKLDDYMKDGNNGDAPGNFIKWLHKKSDVFCYVFNEKWFDIGNMDAYKEANFSYKQ